MFPLGKRIAVSGGASAWTPARPVGGNRPALWLRADDLTGADGDAVSSWLSKEGNTYNFAQSTGIKQPLLKKGANGINGHNVVLFDGSNDILVYAGLVSTATAGSVFMVGRMTATLKDAQNVFGSADEATAATRVLIFATYKSTAPARPYAEVYQNNADGTADDVVGNTAQLATTTYLWVWQSSGTAYTIRVNGADQTLAVVTGANTGDWWGDVTGMDNTTLGGMKWSAENNFYKGSVAELIVYDANLTGTDLAQVESYLTKRYF